MKAFNCSLVVLISVLLTPSLATAQCSTCGGPVTSDPDGIGPYGLKGGPGPGLHYGPGPQVGPAPGYSVKCNVCGQVGPCGPCESCGHWCQYYSEQEKMANDWCRDCCFNWGYQHTRNNALTPHFAPTWHAAVDAQWLLRDGERRIPFASYGPRNTTGSNVFFKSDNFDECMETGFRTTVSRSLGSHENLRLEGSYFGNQQWGEQVSFRDPTTNSLGTTGTIASPFSNFGHPAQVQGLDYNNSVGIAFTSELHSAEINIRHRTGLMCGWLESSMSYGIRYMQIDESFAYQQSSFLPLILGSSQGLGITTSNQLLGAQLGVLSAYRVSDRWWWELDVKATLAGNDASQSTTYTRNVNGATGTFTFNDSHNCMAVIGDINLMSMYQITSNLAIRAGYQMVWVDGLAVAVEQFNTNLAELTQGPAKVNDNGTLVYHGPHMGLILTW